MKSVDHVSNILKKCVIASIKFYKIVISPMISSRCRFYPTCSDYFIHSVEKKGLIKGMASGLYRIARCNPFNAGGHDPVK